MVALCTLAALKTELGISGSSEDTRLTDLITHVSDQIEGFCDRRFERRTLTQVFTDTTRQTLYLSAWPVTSVTSVTDADTVLATDDYTLDTDEGILTRAVYGALYGVGYGSPCGYHAWGATVTVVYTGGYLLPGSVGADLPGTVVRAALDLAIRYYHGGGRDPTLRSETVPGVLEQSWSAVDSIPTVGGLPMDVARSLSRFRRASL